MSGLRERKRRQTYDELSRVAIALFLEKGFDEVAVADIAAAAGVSKPTVFKYFPTKQDLVLHQIVDHQHEAARLVGAEAGRSPVEVLRDHFLAGLERRDPLTGLNDHPNVLAYYRMVFTTPALAARLNEFVAADRDALAAALGGGLEAEVLAACLISTQQVLGRRNWQAISAGQSADERCPVAREEAETAYRLLA